MYALPNWFDPAVLRGRELELVCFQPYGLQLRFANSVSIKVYGPMTLDGKGLRCDDVSPEALVRLTSLPGKSIVDVSVEGRATLALTFDDGSLLRVIEDGDAYECYELHVDGKVVFI